MDITRDIYVVDRSMPLDDRISDALSRGAGSKELAKLIAETNAALSAAENANVAARLQALDPRRAASELADARQAMADATFALDRAKAALLALEAAAERARKREAQQSRAAEIAAARAERDALAAELREVYPEAAQRIADLLWRIEASDRRCAASGLAPAEAEARGCPGNFMVGANRVDRLADCVRLPNFTADGWNKNDWHYDQNRRVAR